MALFTAAEITAMDRPSLESNFKALQALQGATARRLVIIQQRTALIEGHVVALKLFCNPTVGKKDA